jgi:hypothetical protein
MFTGSKVASPSAIAARVSQAKGAKPITKASSLGIISGRGQYGNAINWSRAAHKLVNVSMTTGELAFSGQRLLRAYCASMHSSRNHSARPEIMAELPFHL